MKNIIFGTGNLAKMLVENMDYYEYFIDNDAKKVGKWFLGKKVYAPSQLHDEIEGEFLVIVASQYYKEIKEQLERMGLVETVDFIDAKKYAHLENHLSTSKKVDKLSDHVTKHLVAKLLIENNNAKDSYSDLYEFEFKVYSQWGEDGIIQYLIDKIEIPNKTFIEFGVEDYRESNTRFLLINNNWDGLVIEMDEQHIHTIKHDELYYKYNLKAVNSFITRENINQLFSENGIEGDIGLLSVDIDGNDYWIWKEINVIQPRIVICEYNNLLGLDNPVTTPYQEDFYRTNAHHSNLYYGANLKAMASLAEEKGYAFVGTNLIGTNAFFVRKDILGNLQSQELDKYNVYSKIRESRDINGNLTFFSGTDRVREIKGLKIYNLKNDSIELI